MAPETTAGPGELVGLGENTKVVMITTMVPKAGQTSCLWSMLPFIPAMGGSWDWSGWDTPLACPQDTLHSHCLPGVFAIPRRVTGACG